MLMLLPSIADAVAVTVDVTVAVAVADAVAINCSCSCHRIEGFVIDAAPHKCYLGLSGIY